MKKEIITEIAFPPSPRPTERKGTKTMMWLIKKMIELWLHRNYGKCPDYDEDCSTCAAWKTWKDWYSRFVLIEDKWFKEPVPTPNEMK